MMISFYHKFNYITNSIWHAILRPWLVRQNAGIYNAYGYPWPRARYVIEYVIEITTT